MALKHVLFLLILITCLIANGTASRDLLIENAKQDLTGRFQAKGGDLVECGRYHNELKSCFNEIVHFLTNVEANIGPNCCCAVSEITHNCWPAMLPSLGFTTLEGHYLRSYCDAPALAPSVDGYAISI